MNDLLQQESKKASVGIAKLISFFFRKSLLIYGAIGIFVTVVQIAILFLLRGYTNLVDFVSITIAYIIALVLHYFLNKHLTFLISDKKVFNMMSLRYIIVVIISYMIYLGNIYVFNHIIGFSFTISLFITLFINYIVNYILYEKVVFKK